MDGRTEPLSGGPEGTEQAPPDTEGQPVAEGPRPAEVPPPADQPLFPESPWWPAGTTPPFTPSPGEPLPDALSTRRGKGWIVVVLASLLVAAGAGAGIFLAANAGNRTPTIADSFTPSPAPTGPVLPAMPGSFTAAAISGGEIDLSWAPSLPTLGVTGYALYRDGQVLKVLSPDVTTYQDFAVRPDHGYGYAIEAVSAAGRSPQSFASVGTPAPPPASEAVVLGGYQVSGSYTKENFTNRQVGQAYDSFWFFDSTCGGTKPCDVKTSGDGTGPKKVLTLSHGTYSGKVTIPDGGRCGTTKLDETQTITFTVTRGTFVNGVWTASRISGTTKFRVPSSPGCKAGSGTVAVTGTLSG